MQVTVPVPAGELTGHLATPVTPGPWPGVVVIHEAFGLTDDIRDKADRLAAAGYLALAPDLLSWGNKYRCLVASIRTLLSGQGRAVEDIDGARGWLSARADCTGRVGVIGFCMGGGFALLTAARSDFAASAPNYGPLPKDLEGALRGSCPTVASYGARDRGLQGAAAKLEATFTELGVEHDVKEYPNAGHSFFSKYAGPLAPIGRVAGLGYHYPSAEDAWQRILAFFDHHLREQTPRAESRS